MKKIFLYLVFLFIGTPTTFAQFFTIGEVYDFEVGDEFHYQYDAGGAVASPTVPRVIHRILNKYSTTSHLYYEIGNIDLSDSSLVMNSYLDSFLISSLNDPVIDTTSMWNFGDTICVGDSIVLTSNYYNNAPYQVLFFTNHYPPGYEPPSWFYHFTKGHGITHYYKSQQNGFSSMTVVYCKKGGVEWGNSLYTSINSIPTPIEVSMYPNPFQDYLHIDFEHAISSDSRIEFYNPLGVLILRQDIRQQSTRISLQEELPQGVYYMVLYSEGRPAVQQLIKQ